jgi:YgiT-type zinc finger domain-containing protein
VPGNDAGERSRCARCAADLEPATETLSIELPRTALVVTGDVPAARCPACGDVRVDDRVRERFLLASCCALADAGVRTGEALRHMRKASGLRAADLARLLDVTAETISHWETGKAAPSCAAVVAVCAMVQDAVEGRTTTRDRLAALAAGRAPPPALTAKL